MRIDVRLRTELTESDMDEWRALRQAVHPPDTERPGRELRWADLEPATDYLVRLWDEGELRSCAWVTQRTISIDGKLARVAGVRGVMTHPDHRRRGYGRGVMLHAQALVDWFDSCAFAMLFSSPMAVPFYETLGWRSVAGPLFCDQPGGRIDYTEQLPNAPVMVRMPSHGARPVAGLIDVRGLPW